MANESRSSARKQWVNDATCPVVISKRTLAILQCSNRTPTASEYRSQNARWSAMGAGGRSASPATSMRMVSSSTDRWSSNSLHLRPAREAQSRERGANLRQRTARLGTEIVRGVEAHLAPSHTDEKRLKLVDRHGSDRRRARRAQRFPGGGNAIGIARFGVRRKRRGRCDGREQRRIRSCSVQPCEQRIEIGSRFVLGFEPAIVWRPPLRRHGYPLRARSS